MREKKKERAFARRSIFFGLAYHSLDDVKDVSTLDQVCQFQNILHGLSSHRATEGITDICISFDDSHAASRIVFLNTVSDSHKPFQVVESISHTLGIFHVGSIHSIHKYVSHDNISFIILFIGFLPIKERVNFALKERALLIQCYSGWRPNELLSLRIENINLEEGILIGGSKTEAGKNRPVTIHSRIRPLVESIYREAVAEGRETLFKGGYKGEPQYHTYRLHFLKLVEKLGLNKSLSLHSPRSTFSTMAKENHVDEYALKYMMGHAIKDLTEETYTTRSIKWMKEEIEKIR